MAKQPKGTCALCGYEGTKAALSKHLATCTLAHDDPKLKAEKVFQIRIQAEGTNMYWLDLEFKQKASLLELDRFLRDTWLECCGHLSMFIIQGQHYMIPSPMENDPGDKSMDVQASKVLSAGLTFNHEYDFGTSTYLTLQVISEREGYFNSPIRLLSRNNPHTWTCCKCEKAATWVNSQDVYDSENPFYCNAHMKKHPDNDYAFLPTVNSPRMGMCAYTGEE
jgi:hypothetical protein